MAKVSHSGRVRRGGQVPRWLLALYAVMILGFVLAGGVLGTLLGYEYNLPRIQSLEDYRPDVITDIYSDDSKVIGEFAVERRIVVTFDQIPPHLQLAILAAEDDQFYNHGGINYLATLRAAFKDIIQLRRAEGASTITQQLSRLLLRASEKTFDRKIKELLVAWKIERQYSKTQILTLYCNQHYMGHGAYGVAAAADTYFGKQLNELTLEECALIASLPRNPTLYSPWLHPEAALGRRNYVLDRMVAEQMIPAATAAEAKAKPITLARRRRETDLAPYFVEWVRQSLTERYSTDAIWRKGLRVYTTLNIDMQRAATKAVREGLKAFDKKRGWRGAVENILKQPAANLDTYERPGWSYLLEPGETVLGLVQNVGEGEAVVRIGKYRGTLTLRDAAWTRAATLTEILKPGDLVNVLVQEVDDTARTVKLTLDQVPVAQAALVCIENATGEVKALVGGYDYSASEFNRATQAMRQVGSTFKPIVYSAALEQGMTPGSMVTDSPISFTDALGRNWRPSNYDGSFKGPLTLVQALTESRNIPTIKIASRVGIKNVLVMARRFGLSGPMEPYLPLALGACEATPLEMAAAFTVFPNLGSQPKPLLVRRIDDYDRVKQEESVPQFRKVLEPEIAGRMLGMLENVVQHGTATAARSLARPLGGKTGTTNDFTDAWFVGFSPSLTTAVWVGHDAKVPLGNKQSGAVVALPIWIDYMTAVLKDTPVENFPSPPGGILLTTGSPEEAPETERKIFVEDLPPPARP